MEKSFLFDVVSRIYVATDVNPVHMATYELCCDMIDLAIDVSWIYGIRDEVWAALRFSIKSFDSEFEFARIRCVKRCAFGVYVFFSSVFRLKLGLFTLLKPYTLVQNRRCNSVPFQNRDFAQPYSPCSALSNMEKKKRKSAYMSVSYRIIPRYRLNPYK